jgi:predicted lipid-binding transport protein (Tim44 family)
MEQSKNINKQDIGFAYKEMTELEQEATNGGFVGGLLGGLIPGVVGGLKNLFTRRPRSNNLASIGGGEAPTLGQLIDKMMSQLLG